MKLQDFCQIIGYEFKDLSLLEESLTHPSSSKYGKKNYQRLEFLGDKVLSLVISQYLIQKYLNENEGDLSKRHAFLVSGEVLSEIACEINLDKYLILSSGEESSGGRLRKSNLENAIEALIGAIYLDSNFEKAQDFILNFWRALFDKNQNPPKDPVSELQEFAQLKNKKLPQYEINKIGGTDHNPEFEAIVKIEFFGIEEKAIGFSKKEAQRKVAEIVLEKFKKNI